MRWRITTALQLQTFLHYALWICFIAHTSNEHPMRTEGPNGVLPIAFLVLVVQIYYAFFRARLFWSINKYYCCYRLHQHDCTNSEYENWRVLESGKNFVLFVYLSDGVCFQFYVYFLFEMVNEILNFLCRLQSSATRTPRSVGCFSNQSICYSRPWTMASLLR